jgi:AcrR family transcriptional regulator
MSADPVNNNLDTVQIESMKQRKTYHHGNLRVALLAAAEKVLVRDGLAALSLRAIAREAGVSHGSPAHHFQDLSGLLSDLAAVGFLRLAKMLRAAGNSVTARADTSRAYVAFAIENPQLYSLMFREDRLDARRPSLFEARSQTFTVLREVNGPPAGLGDADALRQIGAMTATWALVHGFAILAIEKRLVRLLDMAPKGTSAMDLLDLAIREVKQFDPPGESEASVARREPDETRRMPGKRRARLEASRPLAKR